MPILTQKRFTRADIMAHPDRLYAFGDNMERRGRKGQARECRGLPNCVGIPTKRRPSMEEDAFFTNADFPTAGAQITSSFTRLGLHVQSGGTVVLPEDGIGTGLAQLPRRAPRIAALIEVMIAT